ncbi:MAG: carbohydrate porin [Chthoniobacterales bacterium]
MKQGFTYTDNIAFGVRLDLEKLVGWRGTSFTIAATDRNGDSLSQDFIGNQFTVPQIYGGQTIILTGLHLTRRLLDEKMEIKAGRFSAGHEFASSPLYWLYMNNGIDGNPQSLPVNASFSAYPWASWAARLRVAPSPDWNAMFGMYQVSGRTFSRNLNGLNMAFDPTDGIMFVGQVGWTPEFFQSRLKRVPTEREEAEQMGEPDDDFHGMPGLTEDFSKSLTLRVVIAPTPTSRADRSSTASSKSEIRLSRACSSTGRFTGAISNR